MGFAIIEDLAPLEHRQSRLGLAYAVGAYGVWGLIAIYFKAVAHVAPPEVLAYRAVWSFVLLAIVVGWTARWQELWQGVRQPRAAAMLALSTVMIAVNWLTFIYAISTGQALESSLGYFINPLVNVLLGFIFLGERLRRLQTFSIVLALAGVVVMTLLVGRLPWVALVLAVSFGFYGLLRKTMPVGGLAGLTVETFALTPLAIAYLVFLNRTGTATGTGAATLGLLALSGLVTTIPLLLFTGAARRLRLSTLGVVQYLSPSLQFLVAVFLFREPFSTSRMASFACIWAAVALYAADALRASRVQSLEVVEPD